LISNALYASKYIPEKERNISHTLRSGTLDATGGYLVVKDDGEILCYHIYNRNDFEEYLLSNTKIINPSLTRLKFGKVYKDNETFYIKLNLQIRFIK